MYPRMNFPKYVRVFEKKLTYFLGIINFYYRQTLPFYLWNLHGKVVEICSGRLPETTMYDSLRFY